MHRQQRLQRVQVVALHDQVPVQPRFANSLVGLHDQGPEGNRKVMVPDEFFALEHQFGHATSSLICPERDTP